MLVKKRVGLRLLADISLESLLALRDNRLRTILSILGIAVGIAAVMAVGTISKGGRFIIFSELGTFGLRSVWVFRDSADKDPRRAVRAGTGIETADYLAIRSAGCSAVRLITPVVYGKGQMALAKSGGKYGKGELCGVGTDYLEINGDTLAAGRPMREEDMARHRAVAIIGPGIRDDLFGAWSEAVGRDIRIENRKFTVIGVLTEKSRDFLASIGSAGGQGANDRILVPYPQLQQLTGSKEINLLQAEAVSIDAAETAALQIEGLLSRRHAGTFTYKRETMARYIKTTENILKWVSLIGVFAASVSLFVGGMGIMNIMSTSVVERTREIGIRKALGASRREILLQFLFEATFISSIGGILGLAAGLALGYAVVLFAKIPLEPSWSMVSISLAVSTGVGLLSGYYPAYRAANLKPVEALRFE